MTRRGAILAVMLLAGGKLMAQDRQFTASGVLARLPTLSNLRFAFGEPWGFTSLEVQFSDGSVVTLSEADIKRELTGKPDQVERDD
jgi:hypothetical protein